MDQLIVKMHSPRYKSMKAYNR